MGLAAFLFSGDVKIAVKVSKTPSRGKIFRKKSFSKFSIRLWVWFFETPDEERPTRFSKLHFSCPEGNLKKKQFLLKTFPQEFCDFEQSNFWTFNKVFFGSFVDITFSVSRVTFERKFLWSIKSQVEKICQETNKQFETVKENFLDFRQNFIENLVKTAF